jgi:OOP family OmpA-OmpF porin
MTIKRSFVGLLALCFLTISMGCATPMRKAQSYPALSPVPPPSVGYTLKTDNLLVLADISNSMHRAGKIATEKAVLTSFNQGIPNGLKNSGLRTFGESAYYDTVLVQPVQSYDRASFAGLIEGLNARCGNTPLAWALAKACGDLEETEGPIALLIVSDGENIHRNPIWRAILLSEMYGSRLCIYTIHVGDSQKGKMLLEEIATHAGCGKAVSACDLTTDEAMKAFITEVFYRHEYRDSDGDGVIDPLDECPDTPKGVKVDENGCPLDSDGDGVPDYLDKCPDTPKGVKVDAAGCWIIKDLKFDYNKWDIRPEYYAGLDNAVHVLNVNPTMKVEIDGHTDSIGSDAFNQNLSEKRAKAVREYLISKGIDPNRLTAKGLGERDPVASNETPEGRAQNRRVVFNVISR